MSPAPRLCRPVVGHSATPPAYQRLGVCRRRSSIDSVPELRAFARRLACAWRLPSAAREDLELLCTELAANAVLHSGSSGVEVSLTLHRRTVRLKVADTGRWRTSAPPQRGDADSLNGRGLVLARAMADVRIISGPDGTTVIAHMLVPPAPSDELLVAGAGLHRPSGDPIMSP